MIKFLGTTTGVMLVAVGFLYYLMQNINFYPMNLNGAYVGINVVTFFLLLYSIVLCFSILTVFGARRILQKTEEMQVSMRASVKFGIFLSLGLLAVYLLHFFHILNFVWGVAILLVVILSLFVI